MYLGIKLHFDPYNKYDYFKYQKKLKNRSAATFINRKDKHLFEKVAKHGIPENKLELYFAANFLVYPKLWIGDFNIPENNKNYVDFMSHLESLLYRHAEEIKSATIGYIGGIEEGITPFILPNKNGQIVAVEKTINGQLTLTAAAILLWVFNVYDLLDQWNDVYGNDALYLSMIQRVLPLQPFIVQYIKDNNINKEEFFTIYRKIFLSNTEKKT